MTTKTISVAKVLLICITVFTACKKDKDAPKDPENEVPQYQLKSIVWSNGLSGNFVYNDNTLQSIDYTFRNVSGQTIFGYSGKTFTEMYDDRSQYKNVFEYDSDGRPIKMRNIERYDVQATKYEMLFHYNSANRIDTLRYFTFNEAGIRQRWVCGYEYNSNGDLLKVTTKYETMTITHTIDAYSAPVSFVPWHYIETTLNENFVVYNLGIMTQFHKANKLPAKVTRIVQIDSDPSYVDKVTEDVFTVNNYKIEKVVSTISYPEMGYINRLEAIYSYF